MARRQVPAARKSGLVAVRSEMDGQRHMAEQRPEIDIGRRVVHGIAAEYQQGLDIACSHG